jgi:hypothetical protein
MAAILDQAWLQGKIEKSEPKILFCVFDVTEILETYSRSRFDFPNTLVETHEHHHERLQFVNMCLVASCKFYMSGCLWKYFSCVWLFIENIFQGKMKV